MYFGFENRCLAPRNYTGIMSRSLQVEHGFSSRQESIAWERSQDIWFSVSHATCDGPP